MFSFSCGVGKSRCIHMLRLMTLRFMYRYDLSGRVEWTTRKPIGSFGIPCYPKNFAWLYENGKCHLERETEEGWINRLALAFCQPLCSSYQADIFGGYSKLKAEFFSVPPQSLTTAYFFFSFTTVYCWRERSTDRFSPAAFARFSSLHLWSDFFGRTGDYWFNLFVWNALIIR